MHTQSTWIFVRLMCTMQWIPTAYMYHYHNNNSTTLVVVSLSQENTHICVLHHTWCLGVGRVCVCVLVQV